jgi:signal transduction histidine kinase
MENQNFSATGHTEMDLQLINLVHDLRRSNNTMLEQKKFSESIIQGLNHGLIVTDLEGNIETFNTLAETIMIPFCDGLSGKNIIDIVGPEAANKMLDTSNANSGSAEKELSIASTTHDNKIIGYSVVARENAFGNEVGRILSINDISEIKYVRREMEKMNKLATVAEIASAVAHEVRNPLAGIKIMAQSLEGQTLSLEDRHECITRIIRQVDRLNSLLTEFFSYARPAAPQVRACSLVDIIGDTQPLIANKMAKNGISFTEHHATDLPCINADPNQVQQVLLNLFLNAIDAIDSIKKNGSITVKTRYLNEEKLSEQRRKHPGLLPAPSYVTVEIADNGVGMAQEIVDNIFEPFFTTKSSGTGLGLSIVYRTLRENNASITVNSSPENGTSFTVYFSVED